MNISIGLSQVLISSSAGSPDESAMLEIQSDSKGLLIPRMTTVQREAVDNGTGTPTEGLLVFDTDEQSFFIYGNGKWLDLSMSAEIWSQNASNVFLTNSTNNVGIGTNTPTGKFVVKADGSKAPDDVLFEVQDNNGDPVFVVTSAGARLYINDISKAASGGFAVGNYNLSKKGIPDTTYFMVSPDSTRVYTDMASSGGFAVGNYGIAKSRKDLVFYTEKDSTRVYTDDAAAASGGFAVGNYGIAKGPASNYLFMVPVNYLIGHQAGELLQTGNFSGKYNTFFGYQAGISDTIGGSNVFIGYKSGYNNTGERITVPVIDTLGSRNVFLGYEAGYSNTLGADNVLLGYQAGYGNTTAGNNVSIGSGAGYSNKVNSDNIFIGLNSGYYHGSDGPDAGNYKNNIYIGLEAGYGVDGTTFGKNNVYIGPYSGKNNTTGQLNVFMGYKSGELIESGVENVIIGNEAGYSISSGSSNTFLGTFTGQNNSSGANNTYIGDNAGRDLTAGTRNTFIGSQAGQLSVAGNYNVFLGFNAGRSHNSGDNNIYMGYLAGQGGLSPENGVNNVFIGTESGTVNTTGAENVFVGFQTGYKNSSGRNNTFLGTESGREMTVGSHNTFMGSYAGADAVGGDQNVFIGYLTGQHHTVGNDNVFLGNSAGMGAASFSGTSERNVILGANAGSYINNAIDNVFIGHLAGEGKLANPVTGDYNIIIGESAGRNIIDGSSNVFMGTQAGFFNELGKNNIFLGYQAGYNNIGDGTLYDGNYNIFIGYQAGLENTTGQSNIYIGEVAGRDIASGVWNTIIGKEAALNMDAGNWNTFIGAQAGDFKQDGNANVLIGMQAGSYASSGAENVMIGNKAGYNQGGNYTDLISRNVCVGFETAFLGIGTDNVLIGYKAGRSLTTNTSTGNIMIGSNAGSNETGSNKLYLDNSNSTSPLIYGEFDNNLLTFNGDVEIANGTSHSTLKFYNANSAYFTMFTTGFQSQNITYTLPSNDGNSGNVLSTNGTGTLSWINGSTAFADNLGDHTATEALNMDNNNISNVNNLFVNGDIDMVAGNWLGIASAAPRIIFNASEIEIMSAEVGIGTTSPGAPLTVKTNSSGFGLQLEENLGGEDWQLGIDVNGNLNFYDETTSSITFEDGGNVGVGTSNPVYKLDINANVASSYAARFFNDGASTNRYGILIQAGSDIGDATRLIRFVDGDGTGMGIISASSGVINYGTKSAKNDQKGLKKTEIDALKTLNSINVVDYNPSKFTEEIHTGFLGEEIYNIFPSLVQFEPETGDYIFDRGLFVPILIKAIQEQQFEIENQQKINNNQNQEIEELKKQIQELRSLIKN